MKNLLISFQYLAPLDMLNQFLSLIFRFLVYIVPEFGKKRNK